MDFGAVYPKFSKGYKPAIILSQTMSKLPFFTVTALLISVVSGKEILSSNTPLQ